MEEGKEGGWYGVGRMAVGAMVGWGRGGMVSVLVSGYWLLEQASGLSGEFEKGKRQKKKGKRKKEKGRYLRVLL